MILLEFFIALAVGFLIVLLLGGLLGRRGPWAAGGGWAGLVWFFLVVFLGAWAVGAWATPIGPVFGGVAWLPFLFGALVFGLLLAALSEPRPRTLTGAEPATETEAVVGGFFWLLMILLIVAITFGSI